MLKSATRQVLSNTAAAVDRAVSHFAFQMPVKADVASSIPHAERLRLLGLAAREYEGPGSETYFRDPRAITPYEVTTGKMPGGGVTTEITWESIYDTFLPYMQEYYSASQRNLRGAAKLFLHPERRPLVICVHGYMGGLYHLEERIFPVQWLYGLGLDVALFTLPFHGKRASPGRRRPMPEFPGADPRMTNEGWRHAMGDLRDLVSWLLDRGHPTVGIMGMSLGGFTTALAATVESRLEFAVPIIPLASFADNARDSGFLIGTPQEAEEQHVALDRVLRVTSPLHRVPVVSPDRVLVIAAEADRITPMVHAERLSRHLRAQLETWPGGHLLQFGRSAKFRSIKHFLRGLGVIEKKSA